MAELSRLPGPSADAYEWQYEGACREADPSLFFHPEGERGPARARRDAAAVAVCAGCPVLQACRSHGLSVREPYGVWGGLTEDDREALDKRERAARRISANTAKAATTDAAVTAVTAETARPELAVAS